MKVGLRCLIAALQWSLAVALVWGLSMALVTAAGSEVLFTIPEHDLYPENVAYDSRSGDYFVSSMSHSRILRVHADGSYEEFVHGPAPGMEGTIGMKADAARRRLWVCSGRYTVFGGAEDKPARTGVLLFDLDDGTLIRSWLVDQPSPAHIFNDLVVAANGDVYATSTLFGKVYRISVDGEGSAGGEGPGGEAMEIVLDTPESHNNGITLGPDERYLFVTLGRSINRLDLKTGVLVELSVPHDADIGTDGLYYYDGSLIIVRPRYRQVARLYLNEALDSVYYVEPLADDSDGLVYPTTGVVAGDAFAFVATSYADVARNADSARQHDDVVIRTVSLSGVSEEVAEFGLPTPAEVRVRDRFVGMIADAQGILTPEGVEEQLQVELGGVKQWINIRGRNRDNPVMLFIHGGPGSPQLPERWVYQTPWEDFFTVVNWEQRGVGKNAGSADFEAMTPTLTFERLVRDAEELVDDLRARFGKEKIVLLGYSYGSLIGSEVARRRPDALSVYVGFGQVWRGGEAVLYRETLARAKQAGDEEAIAALRALAPYPDPELEGVAELEKALAVRVWSARFDGNWYGRDDINLFYQLPLLSPDYSAGDVLAWPDGSTWFGTTLMNNGGMDETDRMQESPQAQHFEVPIVIMMGRYDLMTPYAAAKEFFDGVEAPAKKFVTFERSAHFTMFSEPGRVLRALLEYVLPHTEGAAEFLPDATATAPPAAQPTAGN